MIAYINPIGKPRMTRSDRWRKRDCVRRYFAFKDELKNQARIANFTLGGRVVVEFHIPMPKSWSKKKRELMNGIPHQSKPDIDNCLKALFDSLLEDDSTIWAVTASKYWSEQGRIEIE